MRTLASILALIAVVLSADQASAQPAFPTNVVVVLNRNGSVSLAWDRAISHTNVTFSVLVGVASRVYNLRVDAGTNTTATITNLPAGATYYFAVVATASTIDSEPSNEVSKLIDKPVPVPTIRTVSIRSALQSAPFPDGPWSMTMEYREHNIVPDPDARFYRVVMAASHGITLDR
jgi:hypothetical protein